MIVLSALGSPIAALTTCARKPTNQAARLARDPERPQYHLLPKKNWMNDPNGPVYRDGYYHLFYQYNPKAAHWGDIHWGHAISTNRVYWHHLPVALGPTPGGPDASGCFSGCTVVDGDRVAAFYTGVVTVSPDKATLRDGVHSFRESQCLAIGSGTLLESWKKDAEPVIPVPPESLDVVGFRDPFVWRHGAGWCMVVGSGIRGQGGAVLVYRSLDLKHWTFLDVLAQGRPSGELAPNPVNTGDMWECPNFFRLDDRYVLTYSTNGKTRWISGHLDEVRMKFVPQQRGIVDYGTYYAATSQLDEHGNRVLWGWIGETRPKAEYMKAGWAGVMSLPRILRLDEKGRLRLTFDPAIHVLRRHGWHLQVLKDPARTRAALSRMHIEQCSGEIQCEFKVGGKPFLARFEVADGSGRALLDVAYEPRYPDRIRIDDRVLPLYRDWQGHSSLHLYIDGSVIECIVGGAAAYTKRFYYASSSAPRTRLHVEEGSRNIERLSMWQIAPISRDRLTT